MKTIEYGIYEAILDEDLREAISRRPELRTIFGKIDPEEQPARYAAFVARVVKQALREEPDPERRLQLCNRLLDNLFCGCEEGHLRKHRLIADKKPVLLEITPPYYGASGIPRPQTPWLRAAFLPDLHENHNSCMNYRKKCVLPTEWTCLYRLSNGQAYACS